MNVCCCPYDNDASPSHPDCFHPVQCGQLLPWDDDVLISDCSSFLIHYCSYYFRTPPSAAWLAFPLFCVLRPIIRFSVIPTKATSLCLPNLTNTTRFHNKFTSRLDLRNIPGLSFFREHSSDLRQSLAVPESCSVALRMLAFFTFYIYFPAENIRLSDSNNCAPISPSPTSKMQMCSTYILL